MTTRRVTLADVARLAGVSPTAASLVLNGKPDTRLSADTHARIHAAARELGYRPNIGARALRTDKSFTIGFVSDVVATTRFASGLIKGALDAAESAGHVLLVLETGGDPARETEAIEAVLDRQVDGIVFATMRARELFVPEIPSSTRVVMLNATNERYGVSVLPDEIRGGQAAVDLLAAAGHAEGIALVGHNADVEKDLFRSATVTRRVQGIHAEMNDLGLRFVAEQSSWEWEPANGYEIVSELLRDHHDIRALVCMNDRLAFGAYQAAIERGLRVGEDISVVSFDNDELAAYLRPGLTTVALPHQEMGRTAVEALLSGADGHDGQQEILVPMPVIERHSVRADLARDTALASRAQARLVTPEAAPPHVPTR